MIVYLVKNYSKLILKNTIVVGNFNMALFTIESKLSNLPIVPYKGTFSNWLQVPVNVLKANQECAKQFSFQKMFNLEPLECNVKRDGRTGCILVGYQCEDPDDNGGSAVFPPPGFDI